MIETSDTSMKERGGAQQGFPKGFALAAFVERAMTFGLDLYSDFREGTVFSKS